MAEQVLVALASTSPLLADATTTTYLATVQRSFTKDQRLWYLLRLDTNGVGDSVTSSPAQLVSADWIVSHRPLLVDPPTFFYHDHPFPVATEFVDKRQQNHPLVATSRSALGSGMHGIYSPAPQSKLTITCQSPYYIQDREHSDSITIASLHTNRFLDRIITAARPDPNAVDPLLTANEAPLAAVTNLWNIVLQRSQDGPIRITSEWLRQLLISYGERYLQVDDIRDTNDGRPIQELPINNIFNQLGYDGLIAVDALSNGWGQGCVSYNYQQAKELVASKALY